MGKKRKIQTREADSRSSNGKTATDGRIYNLTSFKDVADSEDEFHINRDKILLDEGPGTKRAKWNEDSDLELSDHEILAYSDSDKDNDEDVAKPKKIGSRSSSETEVDEFGKEDDEEETEGWGASKRDYYNHDQIETEADAIEEEAEARRLQQKKLAKMTAADFGFDEGEWLHDDDEEESGKVVTEIIKDVEITPDMPAEEQFQIFITRYPEFQALADELLHLHPLYKELRNQVQLEAHSGACVISSNLIKCRALAAYICAISMYFAMLTSPARDYVGEGKTLDPTELHDHPVMNSLLKCRNVWLQTKEMKINMDTSSETPEAAIHNLSSDEKIKLPRVNKLKPNKKSKREHKLTETTDAVDAVQKNKMQAIEEDLQELSRSLSKSIKHMKKDSKTRPTIVQDISDASDFGEEDSLDAKSAMLKAQKKKSLRFYTSQIAQKANKRMAAGQNMGGDEDVPHRERLRDRQARLNAEAEKRGKTLDSYGRGGVMLDGQSDTGDEEVAQKIREEGNEYYDMISQKTKQKKLDKKLRLEAIAQAEAEGGLVRVVEGEIGDDGKRAIGYVIEKNKGLAPKRKKDVRNPRVKKRKKFEEKKTKLASMRAVYKGGEERGGYGGEKTGIKSGLVKSIKL
ncbi:BgTH12-04351 [Blumeria graminis f. sp. triticale]|uniref:BgTH12-04351 n=1 Tax=Blumeria graminis f. sp. triticale TaxID=1689686 RepID=A0A9W4CZU7_BLUGR|nr:BgTH12-04351 [Blumeria graminis f. sp. triticale]